MCHQKPQTGHSLDWKTNEPQNVSKNIYDHIYFSKIPAYKICSNCTGKQAFYPFVKNLMGATSFLPGAKSDLYSPKAKKGTERISKMLTLRGPLWYLPWSATCFAT